MCEWAITRSISVVELWDEDKKAERGCRWSYQHAKVGLPYLMLPCGGRRAPHCIIESCLNADYCISYFINGNSDPSLSYMK